MSKYTEAVVVIRPALPRDKADVFEFTKFIWDGYDYVGHIFPEWLADPQGQLIAAEYAGRCVGTGKVTRLAPGEWWLEGFRVDPKMQGLKIGSRIDARCNEWWDEFGGGTLRLITSAKRVQVHHLSEDRGFVKVGEVYGYEAAPLNEATEAFTPLTPPEAGEAVALFSRLAAQRLLNLGWRYAAPNVDSLRAIAEEGLAWWWRGRRGLIVAWEDDDDEGRPRLIVGLEACADEDARELLTDFRRLAMLRGASAAGWTNAVRPAIIEALEYAGYHRTWEDAGFLYERRHPSRTSES
jgi:GNAT superfamily N-acetyltransferase